MKSLKGNVILNRFFICFVASIHGERVFFLPLKIQGGFTERDIPQLASGELIHLSTKICRIRFINLCMKCAHAFVCVIL